MKDRSQKKTEDAELRDYQKKSFAARTAGALLTLATVVVAAYMGRKAGNK